MSKSISRQVTAWLFLAPALIGFAVFSWYPIILGGVVSFQSFHPILGSEFNGVENFEVLFSDPLFLTAWKNTLTFVGLGLLLGFIIPIAMAVLINEVRRFQGYLRVAYYIPAIIPLVVTAILWRWMYDPGTGLFNQVLGILGMPSSQWLLNPRISMVCLVLMSTWTGAASTFVLYLATLQGVPPTLYEAAEIDGATIFRRFWHVTLPSIRPVVMSMLILQVIGTLQVFTEPFVMTDGGPNNATLTVMLMIYRYAFKYFDMGVASALGLTLFLVCLVLTVAYFRVGRRLIDD